MWETWFDPWVGKIWRREVLPALVFWPGEFHGPNSPWSHKELDITKWLSLHFTMSYYLWIFSICLTLDKYLLLSFTCSLILSLNYYRFSHGVLFLSKPKSHPWAWCQDLSLPISAALTITPFTPAKGNNFFFSTSFLPSRLVSASRLEVPPLFLWALKNLVSVS